MDQPKGVRRAVSTFLRRGMLFSIGSLFILQEKTEEFIESAIEKGQEAEREGKKMVQEMRARRKKNRPQVKNALDLRVSDALERLGVPSQQDIDQLDQHVTALSERIDELKSAS